MVDVVICTRNNWPIVAGTIESVIAQTHVPTSCCVVDGQSSDGTPDEVRRRFPTIEVIVKPSDSGPAVSRNLGYARGCGEFVLFLDSDVVLDARWLEHQVTALRNHPGVSIVGGKLLQGPQPSLLHAAHGAINRLGVAWEGGLGERADAYSEPRVCLWVLSAAMLVRRSLLDRIGGFDDEMFAGMEDADFGWRASLAGYGVLFNPQAVAVHHLNQTIDPRRARRRVVHLIRRNRIRMMLVNYQASSLWGSFPLYLALAVTDALVFSPRRPKWSAFMWNLSHLGSTLRRRRHVQSLRRVSDASLRRLFEGGLRGPGYDLARYRTPHEPRRSTPYAEAETLGSATKGAS
jgi:GT2 family glycosyltransferase